MHHAAYVLNGCPCEKCLKCFIKACYRDQATLSLTADVTAGLSAKGTFMQWQVYLQKTT